jgi:hypothetical protein
MAQGVVKGTEFALYQDENSASPFFGIFYTTAVYPTSCDAVPEPSEHIDNIPDVSYALVRRWGNPDAQLAVFANKRTLSTATFNAISQIWETESAISITRTPVESDADVTLHDVEGSSDLVRIDSLTGGQLGFLQQTKFDVSRDALAYTLQSAAHFKFHLDRENTFDRLRDLVTIELYQLEETEDGSFIPKGDNLVHEGHARLILDDNVYGMTLRNNSGTDLFPSLFYFSPSDFSIDPYYVPPSRTMAAPLRRHSALTVGHGNYDGNAIKFDLKPGELSDTGFLVVFLSAAYADMTHIQQSSVLDGGMDRHAKRQEVKLHIWGKAHATITVARTKDDLNVRPRAVPPGPRTESWLSSLQDKFSWLWPRGHLF